LKSKQHKKHKVHVLAKVEPAQAAEIAKVQPEEVAPEVHHNVLIPDTTWQKIKTFLGMD